jgi:hypothetical protein
MALLTTPEAGKIPADPAVSGGFLNPDPAVALANLAANSRLTPDPALLPAQVASGIVVTPKT